MPKGDFIGEFGLYVLLAIVRLGDDAYGIRIRQEDDGRSGFQDRCTSTGLSRGRVDPVVARRTE